MAQVPVPVILMRQVAGYLAMPIFLVDSAGNLVFYNEAAEPLLGRRFEESGEMTLGEWSTIFTPTDESGAPLPADTLPVSVALEKRRPAHRAFWIRGLDGIRRKIEATAFPLEGQSGRHLGAVAVFWEQEQR
jgi:PAS domain-containing protein